MATVALSAICAFAQTNLRQLPDAPSARAIDQHYSGKTRPQGKSLNSRSYAPLTDAQKFRMFVETVKSPLTFFSAGVGASAQYAFGNRMYGGGLNGFGRTYSASLATKESNAFFGRYLFPTLLNQDPRYHPSESRGTVPRAFYAASRVFVTRKDDGNRTANTSYILSTIVSSSLANAYKPVYYRTFGNTASDIGSQIGGDAGMNVLREFWPQLREGLSKVEPPPLRKIRTTIQDKFSSGDHPPTETTP